MKSKIYGTATALVMGSLMISSGQSLAMKLNNQEVNNAEALSEIEFLIAQNGQETVPDDQKDIVFDAITAARADLGDAKAEALVEVQTQQAERIVGNVLTAAETLLGNAEAITDVEILSKGQAEVALTALNSATAQLGDATGKLNVLIEIDPGASAAIETINSAQTSLGNAVAKTEVAIREADDSNG